MGSVALGQLAVRPVPVRVPVMGHPFQWFVGEGHYNN